MLKIIVKEADDGADWMATSTLDDFIAYIHEHPEGFTVRQAAADLGVSRQTIYNHISRARLLFGVALDCCDGRYWLPQRYQDDLLRQFSLTTSQAQALIVAVRSVEGLTPLASEALGLLSKRMEKTIREDLHGTGVLYFHCYDQIEPVFFERLSMAITSRRTVAIKYCPAYDEHEFTNYDFDPLKILYWDRHYYLAGIPHLQDRNKEVIHLRLDRIVELHLTMKSFGCPKDFDARSYVEAAFGPFRGQEDAVDVRLEFPVDKAKAVIGTKRHPSQEHHFLPSGNVLLKLRVPITQSLVWWVVSWPGVRVISPPELRNQVIQHACSLLEANNEDHITEYVVKII